MITAEISRFMDAKTYAEVRT